MKVIKLMIADDHLMVRASLKALLEKDDFFRIVAEADNGVDCLELLPKSKPDILILNMEMPKKNGLEVLKELNSYGKKNFKILVLTGNASYMCFQKAIEYGVDGYLLKSATYEELKKAIILLNSNEQYFQTILLDKKQKFEMSNLGSDKDKVKSLTERELVVLRYLSFGMYNKEIALKLDISERTVKNHISNIFKKIGVADRTQAAVFAIRNFLVDIYL